MLLGPFLDPIDLAPIGLLTHASRGDQPHGL